MFKGITRQISRARKEVNQQGVLSNYLENLTREQKSDNRTRKKTTTALSKYSFTDFDFDKAGQYPGLKSLFYAVFGKQENENDPSRQKYIRDYLHFQLLKKSETEISTIIEPVSQQTESRRTINNLERLTQRIKQNTQHKYPHQEVSAMLQYIIKSAEIEALAWQLEFVIEVGKSIQGSLKKIIRNLKTEDNWGSWELFQPEKSDLMEIHSPGIDAAFSLSAQTDILSRAFSILTPTFMFNRNLESHHKNLIGFKEMFINSLLYDWTEGSGPKTAISKTNQLAGNINAIMHSLIELAQKNQTEIELMNKEKERFIEKAETIVQEN
jgi:hypothetical protein